MTPSLDLVLFTAYREQVERTSTDARTFRDRFVYGAFGVVSETGELVNLIKKRQYPDFHPLQVEPVTPAAIRDEACDVLWYATYLLNLFDVAGPAIHWPERDIHIADETDCSLVLGIEAGAVAWLVRQHLTHRLLMTRSTLAAAINRHCGTMLYTLAWLLDCYGLTLQQAMEASVAKSLTRFPVAVEVVSA